MLLRKLQTKNLSVSLQPFEVFAEVHRVLKPGGSFIVSFSNRMFATKVIRAWLMTGDALHIFFVSYYFQTSGKWQKLTISDITDKSTTEHRDPMYVLHGIK